MDEEAGGSCRSESEASEEEGSGGGLSSEASGEEGESREEAKPEAKESAGRKKRKRRVSAGHRRKIRRRYGSVEDFNPAARSAHTEELERIRRLELQQSLGGTSPPEGGENETTGLGDEEEALIGDDADRSTASGSPDPMLVDLTEGQVAEDERARAEAIVIGSSSDSESGEDSQRGKREPRGRGTQPQGTAKAVKRGAKRLNRKYDVVEPHPDGRVLVNVGHPPEERDVFLAPQIAAAAKPHQVGGIRFMYDNIVESLTRYPISTGFGCILAHSMGLGKTLQVIGFTDIFLRHTPGRLVLCVVPVNTLQNWIAEFDKWLPEDPATKDNRKRKSLSVEKPRRKKSLSPRPANSGSQSLRLCQASPQPLLAQAVSSLGQPARQGEERLGDADPMASSLAPSSSRLQALLAPMSRGRSPSPLQGVQTPPTGSSPSPLQKAQTPPTGSTPSPLQGAQTPPTAMQAPQLPIAGSQAPLNERHLFPNSPYQAGAGSSPGKKMSPQDLKTSREAQSPSPLEGGASGRGLDGASSRPEVIFRSFQLFVLCESCKTMESRLAIISQWRKEGGVLLMGYELYRLLSLSVPSLAGNKMALRRKRSAKKAETGSNTIDLDENEREMDQLIEIQQALCHPGPDLVVCDEGHRIKNDYSNISQALKKIGTKRRIVLTGYPLQNNLMEYWCMVDFVRPNYLGKKQEFADLFERPISNGQCTDSTPSDVRLMRYRSHVLHALMEGFVLRRGHEILRATLLPKFEHVLYLRPSEAQAALYNYFMDQFLEGGTVSSPAGPLRAFAVCSKIWNHPDIYYNEAMAQESKRASPTSWLDEAGLPKSLLSGSTSSKNEPTSLCKIDWPAPLLPSYKPGLLSNSLKMVVTMELVDRAVQVGDRTLIFSQSLSTLSYMEKLLSQRPIPVPHIAGTSGAVQYSNQKWTKNKNYCRLDGSTSSIERDRLINNFNSPQNKECWLFLLSTKAGCLGINLVGANRVIVMDVSWNPCYDSQAVCRVYRYGQEKPCYIYRLVCDGTMERKIFDRQISKQGMADRVIDELHPERHFTANDIYTLMAKLTPLPAPKDLSSSANEFLFDPVLMQLCKTLGPLLTKLPLKHESLLLVSEDERMTEVEKYVAMQGFKQDLSAMRYQAASQAQTYRSQQLVASGQNQQRPQPQQLPQQQQALLASSSGGLRAAVPNLRVAAACSPLPPASQKSLPQAATPHASLGFTRNLSKSPASAASPNPIPRASGSSHGNGKYDGVEVICLDSDSEGEGSPCNNSSSTVCATVQRPNQLDQYTPANFPQSAVTIPQSSGTLLPGPRVISAPIAGAPPFSSSLSSTIANILAAAKAGGGSNDAQVRAALVRSLAETHAQNSGTGNQIQNSGMVQTASQAQNSGTRTPIWNSGKAQTSTPTAIAPSQSGVTTPHNNQASTPSSLQQQYPPSLHPQPVHPMAPSPSRSPVRSPASTTASISSSTRQTHAPTIVQLQTSGDSRIAQQQPTNSVTTTSLDISPKQRVLLSPTATHDQTTSVSTTSLDKHPSAVVSQQQTSTMQRILPSSSVSQQLATTTLMDRSPKQLATTTLLDRSPSPKQLATTTLMDRSPKQLATTTLMDRSPSPKQLATTTLLDRSPKQLATTTLMDRSPSPKQLATTTLIDRSPKQLATTTLLDRSPSSTVSRQQATSVQSSSSERSPRQQMLPSPKSPSSTQLLSPPTPRAELSPTANNNRRASPPWSAQPPDSNYDPSSIPLLSPVAARLFQLCQARESVSRSVSPSPTSTPSPSLSASSSLPLPTLAPLSGKRTAIVPPYSAFPNSSQPSPPPLQYHGKTPLPQQAASAAPCGSSQTPREPPLQAPAASNSVQSSSGRPKAALVLDLTKD